MYLIYSEFHAGWRSSGNFRHKCFLLAITHKKTTVDFNYSLDTKHILKVPSIYNLFRHITDNLFWNEHCDNICKKANSTLGLLRRSLPGWSTEVKGNAHLIRVRIRPKLECASSVWNHYKYCNIDKIEMVQRCAARFAYNDYSRFIHVSPMLDALNWDSLEHRIKSWNSLPMSVIRAIIASMWTSFIAYLYLIFSFILPKFHYFKLLA